MTTTSAPSRSKHLRRDHADAAPLAQSSTTSQAVEPSRPSSEPDEVVDVALGRRRPASGSCRRRSARGRSPTAPASSRLELGLDGLLDVVGQLAAARREQLDAVVGERVVRGRDHGAHARAAVGAGRRRPASARRRGARRRRPRRRGRRPAPPRAAGPSGACRDRSRPGRRRAPAPRRGPSARASSGVSSALATPRTPSVPKRSAMRGPGGSALRVLRRLAGLLEAVLLALLLAGVAGEEAGLLQRGRASRGRAR